MRKMPLFAVTLSFSFYPIFYEDVVVSIYYSKKYDKQDQQGKAELNERNPHTNQQ
jgi:hypothetical protein